MPADILRIPLAWDAKQNRLGCAVEYMYFYGFSDCSVKNSEIAVCGSQTMHKMNF